MHRRIRTLSVDDQKAVDVCLDYAAHAGKNGVTRLAISVPQQRLASASKILALLSEMPAMDPPKDLVAKTMALIDQDNARKLGSQSLDDSVAGGAAMH